VILDAVVVADPRHGDHLQPLVDLLSGLAAAGGSIALLPLMSPLGASNFAIAAPIAALITNRRLRLLSTPRDVHCELAVGFGLLPLTGEPDRLPRLHSRRAVLLIDQPWDTHGHQAISPFEAMLARAALVLGAEPVLLAIAPDLPVPVGDREILAPADSVAWLCDQITPSHRAPSFVAGSALVAPSRVLMLSPNGIGMGHLTRLLAIARHLPEPIEPIFLSMSRAVSVVADHGFTFEYLPGPKSVGINGERWRDDFVQRLVDAIVFYDARTIVFDGNFPYDPFRQLRSLLPERWWIWLRRGLWRPGAGRTAIERSELFDAVIEPGELAAQLDTGLTRQNGDAHSVAPIVLTEPADRLSQAAARELLELPMDAVCVLVQLGSGNNFDMASVQRAVLDHLGQRAEVHVRVLTWLIADGADDPCAGRGERFRGLSGFPVARLYAAFDFAVSAAGYNSFHELTAHGLPSAFVPNENPMMDEQEARALFADRHGSALHVPARDRARLLWALDRLLDPAQRTAMQRRAALLPAATGAAEAAAQIAGASLAIKAVRGGAKVPAYLPRW